MGVSPVEIQINGGTVLNVVVRPDCTEKERLNWLIRAFRVHTYKLCANLRIKYVYFLILLQVVARWLCCSCVLYKCWL